jgi:hypothetical protein
VERRGAKYKEQNLKFNALLFTVNPYNIRPQSIWAGRSNRNQFPNLFLAINFSLFTEHALFGEIEVPLQKFAVNTSW